MKLVDLYDIMADDTPVQLVDTETNAELQYCADVYCWDDTYMECEVTGFWLSDNMLVISIRY